MSSEDSNVSKDPSFGNLEKLAHSTGVTAATQPLPAAGLKAARSMSSEVVVSMGVEGFKGFDTSKSTVCDPAKPKGRIYHDDHFSVGTLTPFAAETLQIGSTGGGYYATQGDAAVSVEKDVRQSTAEKPVPAKANSATLQHQATSVLKVGEGLRHSTTQGVGIATLAPAVSLGTPMPKWPANWTSAAFEAVAVKKSFILSPAEIYAECAHHGEEKAKFAWYKLVMLSVIAGCYVGFGYTTCLIVGGNLSFRPGGTDKENLGLFKLIFGAVGFPFGFTTIVVCGAELYTSLCAYGMAAWWEGKIKMMDVLRLLFVSWWGNFVGCVIMAALFHASEVYDVGDYYALKLAHDKTHHGWGATFVKGIYANWLVGLATWMANAAQDLTGKAIAIWLPISAFAMVGFEHCIANQFLIPLAMMRGADITAKAFIWHNLIPATLGNFIGGGVCVSTTYAFIYGRTPLRIAAWWNANVAPRVPWLAAKKDA